MRQAKQQEEELVTDPEAFLCFAALWCVWCIAAPLGFQPVVAGCPVPPMAPKKNKRGTRSKQAQADRSARGMARRLERTSADVVEVEEASRSSRLPSGHRQLLVKKRRRRRRRTRHSRLVLTEGPGIAMGDTALNPSSSVAGGPAPASKRRKKEASGTPSLIQKLVKSNQAVEEARGDWSKKSFRERVAAKRVIAQIIPRGTVGQSILGQLPEACSTCDERTSKNRTPAAEFAQSRIERRKKEQRIRL